MVPNICVETDGKIWEVRVTAITFFFIVQKLGQSYHFFLFFSLFL